MTRHLSFALVHRLIINYITLKTGSINCHVFCILLSGNTITYQSQWPSRAGSPFPATSSAKGQGNHREPSEVIYPSPEARYPPSEGTSWCQTGHSLYRKRAIRSRSSFSGEKGDREARMGELLWGSRIPGSDKQDML